MAKGGVEPFATQMVRFGQLKVETTPPGVNSPYATREMGIVDGNAAFQLVNLSIFQL